MPISLDASMVGTLFGKTGTTSASDSILGALASSTSSGAAAATPAVKKNPTPPWGSGSTAAPMTALTKSVLGGAKFIDETAAKLDVANASSDYKRLFALYQGLSALDGLATQVNAKGTSPATQAQIQARFAAGMKEVSAYIGKTSFAGFQLAEGTATTKAQTTQGVATETDAYTTGPVWSGDANAAVDAFQGDVAFKMTAQKKSGPVEVDFNLGDMTTPRTMANVVVYMNDQLQKAGLFTRVSVVRNPGTDRTTTANGKTVTLGKNPDSFSFKLTGVSTEALSFSAPGAAPAVYIGQSVGTPSTTTTTNGKTTSTTSTADTQLVKFSTDPSANATDAANGQVFADSLGTTTTAVRASATAADGSLYVLSDVNGTADGQTIKGKTDVVLRKYDSTGALVFSRTLGADANAVGYALAVSADGGKVAIAGSVTGALDDGDAGPDPTTADSFVSVFNADGEELYTHREAAKGDDRATGVAFGADGAVYVTGNTAASLSGAAVGGAQDIYVQGFKPSAASAADAYTPTFTTQYGTSGTDKAAGVAVSGSSLYVAGVENGHAVVRSYDLSGGGTPALTATRDLGDLQGGALAGIAVQPDGSVVVAGSTHNGALDAGAVTTAYAGGAESGFVAKLSSSLSSDAAERLTYVNGSSDISASAMTVAGGQVYLTGTAAAPPLAGQTSATDGFAAAVNATTGAVGWTQTFRGTDRQDAPTTIAVDTSGASVLDRLGFPAGPIDYTGSQQVVANSAARAGDQFQVQVNGGATQTVTIDAADTLDTLATKINRATGFRATATVTTVNGMQQLKIVPMNASTRVVLSSGSPTRDALGALGLSEGLVTTATDKNSKDSVKANYSLGMSTTLDLSTPAGVKNAQVQLSHALDQLKSIYTDMTTPKKAASSASSGAVPAYLTNQIANYQAALQRLTGSG